MSERNYRILIGTAGWRHLQWGNEVFYPEDLPEDWYLSFYANEFSIALVPEKQWQDLKATEQIVVEINEQATPGFKCIFELDLTRHLAGDLTLQKELAVRVATLSQIESYVSGLLVSADIAAFNRKDFTDEIISLNNHFKVCIELKDATEESDLTELIAFCELYSMSVSWSGQGGVIVPEASRLWLARCDSNQDNKALLQQLKTVIAEQLKRESLSREHIIIIDGSPPKIEAVRNANIMLDIM